MIRVVIVDDQELVRAGFRLILELVDGIEVVGEGRRRTRSRQAEDAGLEQGTAAGRRS